MESRLAAGPSTHAVLKSVQDLLEGRSMVNSTIDGETVSLAGPHGADLGSGYTLTAGRQGTFGINPKGEVSGFGGATKVMSIIGQMTSVGTFVL